MADANRIPGTRHVQRAGGTHRDRLSTHQVRGPGCGAGAPPLPGPGQDGAAFRSRLSSRPFGRTAQLVSEGWAAGSPQVGPRLPPLNILALVLMRQGPHRRPTRGGWTSVSVPSLGACRPRGTPRRRHLSSLLLPQGLVASESPESVGTSRGSHAGVEGGLGGEAVRPAGGTREGLGGGVGHSGPPARGRVPHRVDVRPSRWGVCLDGRGESLGSPCSGRTIAGAGVLLSTGRRPREPRNGGGRALGQGTAGGGHQ